MLQNNNRLWNQTSQPFLKASNHQSPQRVDDCAPSSENQVLVLSKQQPQPLFRSNQPPNSFQSSLNQAPSQRDQQVYSGVPNQQRFPLKKLQLKSNRLQNIAHSHSESVFQPSKFHSVRSTSKAIQYNQGIQQAAAFQSQRNACEDQDNLYAE